MTASTSAARRDDDVLIEFSRNGVDTAKRSREITNRSARTLRKSVDSRVDPSRSVASTSKPLETPREVQHHRFADGATVSRAYKRRGIAYKGAKKTTQRVIDFVNSPEVAMADMKIKDMERWRCFEWLRNEGVLETHAHVERALSGETLSPEALDEVVHHVFESAQERANRELWHDTMVTLMCMASTSELKNTPTGNSARCGTFSTMRNFTSRTIARTVTSRPRRRRRRTTTPTSTTPARARGLGSRASRTG